MLGEGKSKKENPLTALGLLGILFIILVFLLRTTYYISFYLGEQPLYKGEILHQTFILLYLIPAVLYLVAILGFIYRKAYSHPLSILLIAFDVLFSMGSLIRSPYNIIGVIGLVVMLCSLQVSKSSLRKWDKKDNYVIIAVAAILLLYILINLWAEQQPTPGEYQSRITNEAISKNDIKICDELESGRRFDCIKEFAVNKKDSTLCNLLANSTYHSDSCYLEISDATGDLKLCQKIIGKYNSDDCFLRIAKKNRNPEICEKINDGYYRGLCYDLTK